jgi:hypothetical protein
MAYDALKHNSKEYLKILHLAARQSEVKVDQALNFLNNQNLPITYYAVLDLVRETKDLSVIRDIKITPVDIREYDRLLGEGMSV